jgi:DNA modification methylase
MGLERTPDEYIAKMVEVFREVRRVLRGDGTCFVNIGDSYARNGGTPGGGNREPMHMEDKQTRMLKIPSDCGLKEKDLVGIPWMLAFALRADGWWLRQDIIWSKPNPMPESVTDRCTKAHEYLFMLTKSAKYYFDAEAIKEPSANAGQVVSLGERSFAKRQADGAGVSPSGNGNASEYTVKETRNKRDVWTVATQPFPEAHFATFPPKLIEPCILAGCPENGIVLDPFAGSGTTGVVAIRHKRDFIGIELNPDYITMANNRLLKELLS